MATIRRLVIVREGKDGPAIFQDLLDRFKGALGRDGGDADPSSTHRVGKDGSDFPRQGVVLTGLKLKKLIELKAWEEAAKRATVLDMPDSDSKVDAETSDQCGAAIGGPAYPSPGRLTDATGRSNGMREHFH
jgi:hypothetical protein